MGAVDLPLLFAHQKQVMPDPKFARKNGRGYEYGHIKLDYTTGAQKYVPVGKAKTLAEAMTLNGMEALACSGNS
jgi:hypothetical protein